MIVLDLAPQISTIAPLRDPRGLLQIQELTRAEPKIRDASIEKDELLRVEPLALQLHILFEVSICRQRRRRGGLAVDAVENDKVRGHQCGTAKPSLLLCVRPGQSFFGFERERSIEMRSILELFSLILYATNVCMVDY